MLWSLVFGLEPFVVLVSNTGDQATDLLAAVKNELESNAQLLADFPEATEPPQAKPGPARWRRTEIITRNGMRVITLGAGQRIRGRRHNEAEQQEYVWDRSGGLCHRVLASANGVVCNEAGIEPMRTADGPTTTASNSTRWLSEERTVMDSPNRPSRIAEAVVTIWTAPSTAVSVTICPRVTSGTDSSTPGSMVLPAGMKRLAR